MMPMGSQHARLCAASVLLAVIAGCGGGGASTPQTPAAVTKVFAGNFIDLPVSGLGYSTASQSGVTGNAGSFGYQCNPSCETISFSLGGLTFGQATAAATLALRELSAGMDAGMISEVTLRRAQTLMSLDSDGDPANGITLTTELAAALSTKRLDFAAASFDSDLALLLDSLRTDTRLSSAFRSSLKAVSRTQVRALLEQGEAMARGVLVETPTAAAVAASEVRKYVLAIPDGLLTSAAGASDLVKSLNPKGLRPAFGEGLTVMPGSSATLLQLRAVTSRGIGLAAPRYNDGLVTRDSSVLLANDANGQPLLGTIELGSSTIALKSTSGLSTATGEPYSGRPTPAGFLGNDAVRNLDASLKPRTPEFDQLGLDPAGLRIASDGNLWLCDRRGPFLLQLDATGRSQLRLAPAGSAGALPNTLGLLPSLWRSRQPGLGCGGVAVRPLSGDIIMSAGAALDVGLRTASRARLIRLLSVTPRSQQVRQFAMAIAGNESALQVLDIDAVNESMLLMLVRYKDPAVGLDWQVELRTVDLSSATELTGKLLEAGPSYGLDLEYGTAADIAASGISLATGVKVLSLASLGWGLDAPQALARVDSTTILVMSNSNGGVSSRVLGGDPALSAAEHQVDSSGLITPRLAGSASAPSYEITAAPPELRQTVLWSIRLRVPLP